MITRYYVNISLSLRKTNSEKYFWWSLLSFTEKIRPLIEKILSTEANEAGIVRYFFAKIASSGKRKNASVAST